MALPPTFSGSIDTHVHFWNPQRLRYPWLTTVPSLNRAYLPADYTEGCSASPVSKFIFVECECDEMHSLEEVAWVSDLAHTEPRLSGIIAHAART